MILYGHPPYANTYLLKRFDQVVIIDPSFNEEELLNEIKGLNVVAILLTHGHYHHFKLIHLFNAPIYIHRNDYKMFIDDKLNGINKNNYTRDFSFDQLQIMFLDDKKIIKLMDKEIEVIHTPGHTEGSCVFLYDNDIFTGDTLTNKGFGKTKKVKGAKAKMRRSVEKILLKSTPQTVIYPGHGNPITLKKLINDNQEIRKLSK